MKKTPLMLLLLCINHGLFAQLTKHSRSIGLYLTDSMAVQADAILVDVSMYVDSILTESGSDAVEIDIFQQLTKDFERKDYHAEYWREPRMAKATLLLRGKAEIDALHAKLTDYHNVKVEPLAAVVSDQHPARQILRERMIAKGRELAKERIQVVNGRLGRLLSAGEEASHIRDHHITKSGDGAVYPPLSALPRILPSNPSKMLVIHLRMSFGFD
ncbi:MAG: hypothetical protein AAF206_05845 [Bacteroidota bacterium]